MITIRIRNIKLNVFLSEEEKELLKEKSNKARLSQFEYIRIFIEDYSYKSKSKVAINNMNVTIFFY